MRHNSGKWVGITEEDLLKWNDFIEIKNQ
jgi:hypothetical protein